MQHELEKLSQEEARGRLVAVLHRLGGLVGEAASIIGKKRLPGLFLKFDLCLYSHFCQDEDGLLEPQYFVADERGAYGHGVVLSYKPTKAQAIAAARHTLNRLTDDEVRRAIKDGQALREQEHLEQCRKRDEKWAAERAAREASRDPADSIPKRRKRIFEKSSGKCHYCGCALDLTGRWHIEHKMPRALLGGSEEANLVASCVSCNMKKKDKTDLEFMAEKRA